MAELPCKLSVPLISGLNASEAPLLVLLPMARLVLVGAVLLGVVAMGADDGCGATSNAKKNERKLSKLIGVGFGGAGVGAGVGVVFGAVVLPELPVLVDTGVVVVEVDVGDVLVLTVALVPTRAGTIRLAIGVPRPVTSS